MHFACTWSMLVLTLIKSQTRSMSRSTRKHLWWQCLEYLTSTVSSAISAIIVNVTSIHKICAGDINGRQGRSYALYLFSAMCTLPLLLFSFNRLFRAWMWRIRKYESFDSISLLLHVVISLWSFYIYEIHWLTHNVSTISKVAWNSNVRNMYFIAKLKQCVIVYMYKWHVPFHLHISLKLGSW